MNSIWFEFSLKLDLLALCAQAGLDFTSSLIEITKLESDSFVIQRFKVLLSHIKLGKTKTQALLEFQKSWPNPQDPKVELFCQTLLYGWQQGISISELLKESASHIRTEAYLEMEKEVQKKSLKLLLPLFLFILPSVILIIMTPLFVQLFREPF